MLLFLIAAVGIALAAGLGLVVAKAVLAPVQRLTRTAEEVSETRDLSRRIDASGNDELSRLAATFNTMLGALEDSARAQRQLVSDASHELRTPLTSLRTNIEVLARDEALPPGDREQLLRDVTEQLTEMTALIAELVELARGDQAPAEPEDVRLDLVTADAIERHAPQPAGRHVQARARAVADPRRARDRRACGLEPARQRRQVEPGRRRDRGHGPRRRADRPRPRPRYRRRRPPLRLRPLLPRTGGARDARARASASRSCARWRRLTAAPSSPTAPTAAAR